MIIFIFTTIVRQQNCWDIPFFVLLLEIIEVFFVLNKLPLLKTQNSTTQLMKQECVAGSLYDIGRKKETSLTQHQYQLYYQWNYQRQYTSCELILCFHL